MRIAISGSSGLVGTRLCKMLVEAGHTIVKLVRSKSSAQDECYYNWQTQSIEKEKLEGIDACIHLAGENVAARRWSAAQKKKILDSRVRSTQLIAKTLNELSAPPETFISASAVGFYGDKGNEEVDEQSSPGSGFLSDVCVAWEAESKSVATSGTRVVQLRIGVVIDPAGGALQKMLLPFKLGLGGPIADGSQYISWISNKDLCQALIHILNTEQLAGPINAVAPTPVTNREFTKLLGQALRRPTFFALPAIIVKLIFGELGEATLLSSTRAVPMQLLESGYSFSHPTLKSALDELAL